MKLLIRRMKSWAKVLRNRSAALGGRARRLRRMHDEAAPPANLTRAEIEALGLVRDGYLMKEIAGRLGVTEGAVKQRLKHAKTKLGARTSGQAVSKAIAFGLI